LDIFEGKTILVTGGTGSFGRKAAEIVLESDVKKLVVVSRDELKQARMREEFDDKRLRFIVGDVRDRWKMFRVMQEVDFVYHAAAMKRVPVCEYNPDEAKKTNVDGTINVRDACISNHVKSAVFIGTDKAVAALNTYGKTKALAEALWIQGNYFSGRTKLIGVRYGNVIGSRGSVVSTFKEQAARGVIRITDERMTRFWIELDEAFRFATNALLNGLGGEVFIPKLPSMQIIELVRVIADDTPVVVNGIRAGEKLAEVLISSEEARRAYDIGPCYVLLPDSPNPKLYVWMRGTQQEYPWNYSSSNNTDWLTRDEMETLIDH